MQQARFPAIIVITGVFVFLIRAAGTALAVPPDPLGGTGGGPINGSLHVRVVHDGTTDPIAGAFVMVGAQLGGPLRDTWGSTSETGEITFTNPEIQGPTMVTAGAAGHQYFTYVAVNGNDLVIPLKPISPPGPIYRVGDSVSGIDVNNGSFHAGDGNLDMAFVLPSMRMDDLVAFDLSQFFGPPETITILDQPVDIPSNGFIPQQWELFIEIRKDHYYLDMPAGDQTLTALSGRIPTNVVLSAGAISDLLPAIQWRETDILSVNVTGDMSTADLNVDPDLQTTVTLNLANIPEGSTAYCVSLGDLDHQPATGRLVPLGLNSLACAVGSGGCAGTVQLPTTPASGEFAGMTYFPAVAVDMTESEDLLILMNRDPHPQTYTESMSSYFAPLDLAHGSGTFSWNDAANPGNGSPLVHVQTAYIRSVSGDSLLWEFMIPGAVRAFERPILPPWAPPSRRREPRTAGSSAHTASATTSLCSTSTRSPFPTSSFTPPMLRSIPSSLS